MCVYNTIPPTLPSPSFGSGQPAYVQCDANGSLISGGISSGPTTNRSVTITTGSTFQNIITAGQVTKSLTIQNNNTNGDNCWIFIGGGTATKATSILLSPGQSYGRYGPFVPSDVIQGTCATGGGVDSIYVDTQ
jgi:hypothetical protein